MGLTRKKKNENLKRINKMSILLNNMELSALNKYCQQFKVKNKSQFMREAIITEILKKFDRNYPTLWDEKQLRLF